MLSGETANGDYPLQAVQIMARVCAEAELVFNQRQHFEDLLKKFREVSPEEAIARAAVQVSLELNTKVIVCMTETGRVARYLAKYRPLAVIVAVSIEDSVIKGLTISRGVTSLRVPSFQGQDSLIEYAIKHAKENKLCKTGDSVIAIQSIQEEDPEKSNILKILTVS